VAVKAVKIGKCIIFSPLIDSYRTAAATVAIIPHSCVRYVRTRREDRYDSKSSVKSFYCTTSFTTKSMNSPDYFTPRFTLESVSGSMFSLGLLTLNFANPVLAQRKPLKTLTVTGRGVETILRL